MSVHFALIIKINIILFAKCFTKISKTNMKINAVQLCEFWYDMYCDKSKTGHLVCKLHVQQAGLESFWTFCVPDYDRNYIRRGVKVTFTQVLYLLLYSHYLLLFILI